MSGPPEPPVPYDERKVKRSWTPERWDRNLPKQKGFISDMVLALRGTKIPSSYAVWCAVSAISSVVKREAWFDWGLTRLFTNFYIVLVGPPSVCGKDEVISFTERVLAKSYGYIWSENIKIMKHLKIVRHQGTKEFMRDALALPHGRAGIPLYEVDENGVHIKDRPLLRPNGSQRMYMNTSEVLIVAPELTALLGKEKYNEGTIDWLVHIYRTHDRTESGTKSGGLSLMFDLHTNLLAGTQPDAIRDSLPQAAHGEGFLSRTIVVYHGKAARRVPKPYILMGVPTEDELAQRLAWIAENAQGRYSMTEAADRLYTDFYNDLMDRLDAYPEWIGVMGRMDTNLMKLSLLMRAQRYEKGSTVEKEDVEDAIRVLNDAVRTAPIIAGMIHGNSNLEKYKAVAHYLYSKRPHEVLRIKMLQNTTVAADDLTVIVNELAKQEMIEIRLDGRTVSQSSRKTGETYTWVGGDDFLM